MKRRRLLKFLLILAPAIVGTAVTAWPFVYARLNPEPYRPVDLLAMGSFPFNDQTGTMQDVPEEFRKLDGTKVSVTGMMWSPTSANERREFQLVYNIQGNEHRPPQVQERIFVHLSPNSRAQWIDEFARVRGTLHVKLERNDMGTVYSLYTMTDPIVDPASPPPTPPQESFAWRWGLAGSAVLSVIVFAPYFIQLANHLSVRDRRRRAGLCPRCGYDLRASPLRCPECGESRISMWYEMPE